MAWKQNKKFWSVFLRFVGGYLIALLSSSLVETYASSPPMCFPPPSGTSGQGMLISNLSLSNRKAELRHSHRAEISWDEEAMRYCTQLVSAAS